LPSRRLRPLAEPAGEGPGDVNGVEHQRTGGPATPLSLAIEVASLSEMVVRPAAEVRWS